MKRAALLSASGIGDGLLMMIGANSLRAAGHSVTLFHESGSAIAPLFDEVEILPYPKNLEEDLIGFDRVLVENDHSERAYFLGSVRKNLPKLTFFFPTPSPLFRKGDYLFDPKLPAATNLALGCEKVLQRTCTKENGLVIPKGGTHRKFPNRVAIHPTSNDPKRNWNQKQYLELKERLTQEGFEVVFCVGPDERKDWKNVPTFESLKEVAHFLYESGFFIGNDSGLGHLASNLGVPTLTISGNPKRVRTWRPDWSVGSTVTPPIPLPNFKGIGLPLRQNFWQHFISVDRTLRAFRNLIKTYESSSH